MEIILAKNAGFCWGVKRAMDIVLKTAGGASGRTFTYGPLIHNQEVVDALAQKGIQPRDDFGGVKEGTVIIRTHGMPPKVKKDLQKKGLKLVDATCPHVSKTQKEVEKHYKKGYTVVIVGDLKHAEVISLSGHSDDKAFVVSSLEEAERLNVSPPILIVAQSTFNKEIFHQIVEYYKKKFGSVNVFNSICRSATNRQKEVLELAKEVDAMIVVGGASSANTKRLVQISESTGVPTYYAETARHLDEKKLKKFKKVGVTAGASTPDWVINEIIEKLKKL